jgi:hypothetical protein
MVNGREASASRFAFTAQGYTVRGVRSESCRPGIEIEEANNLHRQIVDRDSGINPSSHVRAARPPSANVV